ncbi:MAG: hypothetical protein ABIA37_04550 [Candidatus Woesearchaeota archaeon]
MSNRSSREAVRDSSYLIEIKAAVKSASTADYQQERPDFPKEKTVKPLQRLDDLNEEFIFSEQNDQQVDYGELFSYLDRNPQKKGQEYQEDNQEKSKTTFFSNDAEAEQTVQKIQLGFLLNDSQATSYEEKEKFNHWEKFNQSLLMLYHVLSPIRTDNVDYSRIN